MDFLNCKSISFDFYKNLFRSDILFCFFNTALIQAIVDKRNIFWTTFPSENLRNFDKFYIFHKNLGNSLILQSQKLASKNSELSMIDGISLINLNYNIFWHCSVRNLEKKFWPLTSTIQDNLPLKIFLINFLRCGRSISMLIFKPTNNTAF